MNIVQSKFCFRSLSHDIDCLGLTTPTRSHRGRQTSHSTLQSPHQSIQFSVSHLSYVHIPVFSCDHVPRSLSLGRFLSGRKNALKRDLARSSSANRGHPSPYRCPHFYPRNLISCIHCKGNRTTEAPTQDSVPK